MKRLEKEWLDKKDGIISAVIVLGGEGRMEGGSGEGRRGH